MSILWKTLILVLGFLIAATVATISIAILIY